jgi:formylglycine-generating enzyme required for sulfatase activity
MKELGSLHSRWRFLTGSVALLAALAVAAVAQAAAPRSSAEPASDSKGTAEVYTVRPFDAKQAAKMQAETAEALGVPKLAKVDLGGGVTIEFVLIPAGKCKTGDGPGRDVTVDKPFYMGKFAVTQAQYTRIMGKNPSLHRGRTNPADSINWAAVGCSITTREMSRESDDTQK